MPDRVVVVTGASSGIGEAVAQALDADGTVVAALSRSAGSAAGRGPRTKVYLCDVGEEGQVGAVIRRVIDELGRIDGVVNSAGILHEAAIGKTPAEATRKQFTTNVYGLMTVTEACLPELRKTRGAIVNVSSVVVERPRQGFGVYAATKGAVEAYSRSLALEAARDGVRVNVVRPGTVRSKIRLAAGMSMEEDEAVLQRAGVKLPLGRAGEADDVVGSVRFLLSEEARWITGAVLCVDGGRTGAT